LETDILLLCIAYNSAEFQLQRLQLGRDCDTTSRDFRVSNETARKSRNWSLVSSCYANLL